MLSNCRILLSYMSCARDLSFKRNASDEYYLGNYVDDPQIILLPQ